jgi:hypothetical protein
MNQEDASKATDNRYYTFRVRKRDVYGLALVLSFWLLWSEGAEIAKLSGNLFDAMK